jgi:hypothetical protein
MYSYATKFMPSRTEEMSITSATRYSAHCPLHTPFYITLDHRSHYNTSDECAIPSYRTAPTDRGSEWAQKRATRSGR